MYLILSMCLTVLMLGGCEIQSYNSNDMELVELNYDDIKDKLIRFHVIANSDTEEDQALKLKVRDEVVNALSNKLEGVNSLDEAKEILNNNIDYVNDIARNVIESNNYNYEVNTMLSHENFPDKVYGDCIVPQGNYEAFRVIIGSGEGQNWWCVMFPTLCFVDESKNSVDTNTLQESLELVDEENIEAVDNNEDSVDKEDIVEENSEELNEEANNDNGSKIVLKWKIGEVISNLFK